MAAGRKPATACLRLRLEASGRAQAVLVLLDAVARRRLTALHEVMGILAAGECTTPLALPLPGHGVRTPPPCCDAFDPR